ncbi:hypothetical protein P691DRAFT_793439 [Macrolepiota fuliginosa MF-IS2]|uniref:Uncharacterized protein n=1 Tax=Macrolepiota fuliginosa MF-IS2 TaxID=1400762 RepID=A0A9P6C0L2_9AGAR|nr:hypothetical protein P691DRAFT_793439 [Macrolepiota fuliginosa MF-IS2]
MALGPFEECSSSSKSTPPHSTPSSFIYLALYNYLADDASIEDSTTDDDEWPPHRLSWRLIPSESPDVPTDGHEIFGIHHDENSIVASDNEYVDDPMEDIRAFIRLPAQPSKSYDDLVNQIHTLSDTFLSDAMDDGWQEWEWVYNVFETLEILDYLDDRVTNTWQYSNKPKMEIFKEKILNLAKQVHDREGPPETRVIDFPLAS